MMITFHTALITGSSRGFGRVIAVKLAQEGIKKIAVHYLTRKDEAEKTVSLVDRDSSLAWCEEHADGVRAGFRSDDGIVRIGQAANLDPEHIEIEERTFNYWISASTSIARRANDSCHPR